MPNVFNTISSEIDKFKDGVFEKTPYYLFEPWDVDERPQWVVDQAREDSIDLYGEEIRRHIPKDPHPFQSGYLMSTAFFRSLLAGTSVGKSFVALIEGIMMVTAEIPISLRHPRGTDTLTKRLVTRDNIIRFGRFDSSTGLFIDKNPDAPIPEAWKEWDCGTIKGAGIYPKEKIAPPMSEVWLGTYMKAMNEYWWPRFHDKDRRLIPEHLIDKTKGNEGYNVQDKVVYFMRGGKLSVITYESGYNRFEAERVWACILDEEPDNSNVIQSAQQHCRWMSLVETPYRGITYSRDLIFPKKLSPDKKVFHATQYDSPYQSADEIRKKRDNMNPWDIGARVWGIHSEVRGKPYYDRMKIQLWLQRFSMPYEMATFVPSAEYFSIAANSYEGKKLTGLMEIPVKKESATDLNSTNVWKIYEDRKPFVPYVMSVDPAEGAENPEDAADCCAAYIMRPGVRSEDPKLDEPKPKMVACLRSTLETVPFARVCSHALRYYNNSLLAAETKRAACNATFASELRDYPYWFKMVTVQDSSQKPRRIKGFDTNSSTRSSIFDLIGSWMNDFKGDEYPMIPDESLLLELAACVVGKNNRPDHTSDGTLDSAVCFGILLYVFKHAPEQIIYNGDETEPEEIVPYGKILNLKPRNKEPVSPSFGATLPQWRQNHG